MKKLFIAAVACTVFCSCTTQNIATEDTAAIVTEASSATTPQITEYIEENTLPYMLICGDRTYRYRRCVLLEDIDLGKEVYLGKIEMVLEPDEKPEENFHANFLYEGAEIYTYGDNEIVIIKYYGNDGKELTYPEALVCGYGAGREQ